MIPLSEELRQASCEIETWVRLHTTEDDVNLGIWRALLTIDKAVNELCRLEGEL